MHDDEMESRLRETPLPLPPEGVRALLQSRAEGRRRGRRVMRWEWALAAGAALLVAINLGFDAHHARRMEALLGPAPAASAVAISPKAWAEQRRMMAEALGELDQPERGPNHDHGPVSDLPATRARVA